MEPREGHGRVRRLFAAVALSLAAVPLSSCLSSEFFDDYSQHVWDTAALMEEGGPNGYGADYPLRTIRALGGRPRLPGDRVRDRARGTAGIVASAGLDYGQSVAVFSDDFLIRAMSAVVGREGRVTAWRPATLIEQHGNVWGSAPAMDRLRNVSVDPSEPAALRLPSGLDLVLMAGSYHALHVDGQPSAAAAAVNAAAFRSLRPGGRYVIIDRHTGSGSEPATGGHGIDVEDVIAEVQAAGFSLEGRADLFVVPEDPRIPWPPGPTFEGRRNGFQLRFRRPPIDAP